MIVLSLRARPLPGEAIPLLLGGILRREGAPQDAAARKELYIMLSGDTYPQIDAVDGSFFAE